MTTPDSPLRDAADSPSAGKSSPTPTRNATVTSNQIDATPTSPSTAEPGKPASGVPADYSNAVRPAVERATSEGDETRPRTPWRRAYATRLWVSDLFVLVWTVYGTQLIWFGWGNAQVAIREDSRLSEFSYWLFSAGLVIAWMWALSLFDSRDHRVIGAGSAEYVRVARASLGLFGVLAIFAFLLRIDVARGYLLIALPLGIVTLVVERWMWRQWLIAHRTMGEYSARVLLVGSPESVAEIAREFQRSWTAGYIVVGACTPTGKVADTIPGTSIPIMGNVDNVEGALAVTRADTVAVTSTDDLPPSKVKQISWALETGRQHLVLAPSIVDIAGPRIHTRPVAGLPLIHVETPKFSRGQAVLKRSTDLIGSAALILVLSPVFVVLAAIVKMSSPGPVLYRQERIGRGGGPFKMLKFRSMRTGADQELRELLERQGTTQTPLFKVRNDPRVTPVGRVLRKYSLDELPQLFNVLGGSMSLVGPRPQIAQEVALYTSSARRRLLARPGVTGLWQVSGRSTVDWHDAVRLDLYYVENWSFLGDMAILIRTVRAVLLPGSSAH